MTRRIGTGLCVLRFFFTLSGTGHERVFLGLFLSLASSIISFGGGLGLRREEDLCRFFLFRPSCLLPSSFWICVFRDQSARSPHFGGGCRILGIQEGDGRTRSSESLIDRWFGGRDILGGWDGDLSWGVVEGSADGGAYRFFLFFFLFALVVPVGSCLLGFLYVCVSLSLCVFFFLHFWYGAGMDSSGLLHRGYWFFVLADTPHCRRSLELFLVWRVLGELGPAMEVGRDGWFSVLLLSGRAWRRDGWGCGRGTGWCFVSSLLRAVSHRRRSLNHSAWVFLSGRG